MEIATSHNMGFMQCGVEGIIEPFVIFIRKKTFPITFFCNLVIGKVFCSGEF